MKTLQRVGADIHFINRRRKDMTRKIPDDQRDKFKNQLDTAIRARAKVLTKAEIARISFEWITAYGEYTICKMRLNDITVHGLAVCHPKDKANDFVGHSLSFNRAFDELENRAAAARHPLGFISSPGIKAGEMVFAGPNGELRTYQTAKDVLRYLKEHPIEPAIPLYHTGLKPSHDCRFPKFPYFSVDFAKPEAICKISDICTESDASLGTTNDPEVKEFKIPHPVRFNFIVDGAIVTSVVI